MAHIFVMDDSPDFLDVFSIILNKYQHEATIVTSVKDMYGKIRQRIPDLFLMDIKLPDGDGRELCLNLKQQFKNGMQPFPIVLMSGDHQLLEDYKKYEADGYLQKPFTTSVLIDKIEKFGSG